MKQKRDTSLKGGKARLRLARHAPMGNLLRKNEQCQRTNYIVDPFSGRRIETVIFERWAPSHTEFTSPFLRRHCTIGHLDLGNTLPKPNESPRPGAATKYQEKFVLFLLHS